MTKSDQNSRNPAFYRLSNLRTLLVDDNNNILELVGGILESFGAKDIHKATDVDSAFDVLRHNEIDLIITDWAMEPVDGIELVRRIRSDGKICDPKVPIIMLTGHTEMDRVVEARDAGVTDFLAKPVTPRGLYDRISQLIDEPRSFLRTENYFGPDRRDRQRPFIGQDRRLDDSSAQRPVKKK